MNSLVLLLFYVMTWAKPAISPVLPVSRVSLQTQTLVIIGDSLTEGYGVATEQSYPHLLQIKLENEGKKWIVINHGISGSTSASAAARVRWVLKNPPQIIILALGANDGLRGVKPEITEKNLDQAIVQCLEAKVKIVLSGMKMPPNYGGPYRKEFEALFPRLAKKHHIKLIPFLLEGVGGVPELNQKDGQHPNARGHAIIAETIYKAIQSEL